LSPSARIPANKAVVRKHGHDAQALPGKVARAIQLSFAMKAVFPRAYLSALTVACVSCLGASAYAEEASLKETVVTAMRVQQPLTDVLADVTVMDRETIERSGATGLADVLARLPGFEFSRNGGPGATTSMYLRGAESRFTAVYIDGVRVDSQSTGGAPWEALPLSQIDRIEVLRGPAGAIYGSDAIAGVVQIFTRKGEGPFAPYVGLGVGSRQTHKLEAGFSGGQGVLDYSFGVAHEESRGFNAKTGGNPDADGYRNHSANARLGLQLHPLHRLEMTLLESKVNSQYDGSMANDDRNLHLLQTTGLNWQAHWSDVYRTKVSVTEGHDRYETQPSAYLTDTRVRAYLWHNEWRHGQHTFTGALERREDELNNASTTPVNTRRVQDALALGYGLSMGKHAVQLNLRHDDDSEFGGKSTGSAAYAFAFTPQWRVTASAGTAFRAPTLFHRFSIYGVPSLTPETSRNMELGLRYAHSGSTFNAVLYRNRVNDLITYVSGPGSCINGSGTYAGCYGNTKHAQYEGLTLSATHRLMGVNLMASLDVQNPQDLDTGKQLARRARHHAVLGADTRWGAWLIGAEAQMSGRRYDNASNTVKLAGYGVFNVYASTQVAKEWTLQARIDNVGDKFYQLANNYNTAGRTFYMGLKWAPL
jgi:vitamin B12 transporter